ncbi:MAG: leucine-rich repeat protein [Verrucomicrobiota bacterium]|nr:leucine-rich repeat protein [Verrucomicrobiota bacterium]
MQLTLPSALTPGSPRSRLALLPWLTCLLFVLLVPAALRAATYTLPGTNIALTYSLSGNPVTATITGCNYDAKGALTIPDTLGGVPVTSIGDSAFYYCSRLTSVTISNNVTFIGDSAFYYCSSLTSVTISNSVTAIGDSAFRACSSLTSVTIPNSVTSIGYQAFYSCTSLTSVTITNSVTSIGGGAFDICTNLTAFIVGPANNAYSSLDGVLFNKAQSVLIQYPSAKTVSTYTIPNSVTSIGAWAFYYCTSVTSVTIPNNVTSIGSSAFYYCTSLTSVTISNSLTSIGSNAFLSCTSLTSVTIPNSVTSISDGVFSSCTSLTSVTIPNSVTSIGARAFSYCSSLTSVTIPNSVTSIGNGAFYYCSRLTSVTIPNNVTSIGDDAFRSCLSLISVTIPNSVTYIGSRAFYNCTSLISVTIPSSVTSISAEAFVSCTSLTSVTIPISVTAIGYQAFEYCTSLTSVTIPNSVTSIGSQAFSSCTSLTSVTLGNSVTTIDYEAFSFCSKLTSVTIPNSVTSIGSSAFYFCSSLTSVTIPNSVTSIGYDAFSDCSSLTSVTIPNSVTSIRARAFRYCTSLISVTIPNSVTAIDEGTFYFCTSLTSVTIPSSVTSIEDSAFADCWRLKSTIFEGNAPANFRYNVFYNTDSAFTIYYWANALGFTTPTWKGYPTSVMTCIMDLSGNQDFGAVFLNQTATQTLTLNNTGNATLTVSAITYPSGFSGNWSSGTIAAGASQNITVSFTPTQAIAYSGTITITANETSGTNSIACSGAGILDGFALIPAGEFQMGDSLGDGFSVELPVHTVYTSAFYMGRTDVTKAQWDAVRTWALTHGYTDLPTGGGKGSTHPVHTVSWYDCVKWCNARSESEDLTPVYSVSGSVYRTGQNNPTINYSANGYRLPTEAEWEKAARGGLSGQRFPWGNTITHSQANYYSHSSYTYDISPTRGSHPTYNNGSYPYTSPVGSFAPNGYGLYDMAGNVWQWCGDWSGAYSTNPTGPGFGSYRVLRGGDWRVDAFYARVSYRSGKKTADSFNYIGFRLARSSDTRILSLNGNLNFGSIFLNQTATQPLTLSNTGNAPLTVSAIAYPAGFSGDWSSGTIAPGANQNITVSFTPTQAIAYSGTISITADQTNGTNTIACSGAGVPIATFADWSTTAFTPEERNDPAISGPLADPDNSGLNNLIRYAFSLCRMDTTSPHLPVQTVILDTASNNNPYNTTDFTVRNDPQLTYRIEVSSDMVNWHYNGDGHGGPYVTVTPVDNGDGTTSVHAQDLTPVVDTQPRYSRVVLVHQ